jgi:hypothetical protein
MPTYAVTIAGTSKELQESWNLRAATNSRHVLSFEVLSAAGTYRPALNDEVLLTENGTRIFGGVINQLRERGSAGFGGTAMTCSCSAVDFNALADRRLINGINPSQSLKATLQAIEPFLTPYGVALDAAQVTGPTLAAIPWVFMKVNEILDQLTDLTNGYRWEIDYNKAFRMFLPTAVAAPFNLVDGDGNAIGDIEVEPSRNDYATKVWVLGGGTSPYVAQANDGGPTSAMVEAVVQYPDVFDTTILDGLAVSILAQRQAQPRTVRYTTRRTGLKPGQSQTLTIPSHSISAVTFTITEIETRGVGASIVDRTVTLVEGTLNAPSWRDVYKQWAGGGTGASSGTVVFSGGVTPGPAFLGGSRNTSIAANPAAYVPVPDFVPFTAATSFSGRVRADAWTRDAAISVTLRLRNVTDSTTTGTSSVVTSQTATEVTFNVTITAGKTYRLEMLSSANSKGVFGIGVLESL